jgi:hypothetical protein
VANNNQIYKFSNAGGFKSLNRYYDMLAGNTVWNPWSPEGAFDSLATVTVGATAVATVTFAGIPNTYKHLQLRIMNMNTSTSAAAVMRVGTGGVIDTSAGNYYAHRLSGNGATASAGSNADAPQFAWVTGNSATNIPSIAIIDILDYANTSKFKTIRALSGVDNNGSGEVDLTSGLWRNTSKINAIQFAPNTGSFGQYSQFTLYGVR